MSGNNPTAMTARKRALVAIAACLLGTLVALCWCRAGSRLTENHPDMWQAEATPQIFSWSSGPTGVSERSPEAPASPVESKSGQVAIIGENGTVTIANIDSAELQKRLAWANSVHGTDGRP